MLISTFEYLQLNCVIMNFAKILLLKHLETQGKKNNLIFGKQPSHLSLSRYAVGSFFLSFYFLCLWTVSTFSKIIFQQQKIYVNTICSASLKSEIK